MQSSLWKLLTAAGIIGIGTLVVLEVQNRLPARNSTVNGVTVQSTGTEISVTPDATTPFDEELAAASMADGASSPDKFDGPRAGVGQPAPPADNSKFFGAAEERTVHKDELTDNTSPFAVSLTEPEESDSTELPSADEESSADFRPDGASVDEMTSAAGDSVPEMELPAADDDAPVIPFPNEIAAAKTAPSVAATSSKDNKSSDKKTMMFFPNGGKSEAKAASSTSASTPTPAAAPVAASGSSSFAASEAAPATTAGLQPTPTSDADVPPTTFASDAASSATKAPSAAAAPKPVQSVQRTSASSDEPSLFLPDPVPDVTSPPVASPRSPSRELEEELPSFEPAPFVPDPETTDTPAPPLSGTPMEDEETLPFMPDESPEPARDDLDPADVPLPSTGGSVRDREFEPDDSGSPLPFEPDSTTPRRDDSLPLPAADDLPDRVTRPGRDRDTDAPESTRTVSEVMRPQLTIQKKAPNTATVGVAHDYTILVTNEGASSAYDVVVEDELGGAAEFVQSKPVAEFNRATDQLNWSFRELRAGEKKEITVRIRPTGEGTLDGVATVKFKAQVKSATVITAPKLELELTGPSEVKVGDEVQLTYSIRNRGSGDASNVVLRSVLPPGLKHPEGGDLEYEIENLPAGGSENVDLTVIAAEPGDLILVSAEVTSSGISAAKARTEIEVVGAQLTLERLGPERRYVGRSATYQNIVTNDSKFEAINATVVEEVPQGLRFVSASGGGVYNPDNRRIQWSVPKLAAGKQLVLEVELIAEEAGQMETIVEVTENAGFRTPLTENTIVIVEDLHNVTADISRQDEPVQVGERFGFTVTIDNRGTAVARNVEMSVQVPAELKVLAAGTRQVPGKLMPGNIVKYNRVLEIGPNEQMTFQLTLQGQQAVKNAVVEAFLKYDEMQKPLIVSESVTVYDDRP
jgi:uncharacterized repeat protein (TIGR01451 family)